MADVRRSSIGRYELIELIGTGAMGAVYRARDPELDEIVALKIIRDHVADVERATEMFRREVKLARRVTHRNVARTFELGRAGDVVFCTMELVDGESLASLLERRRKLPPAEAADLACALCDGLAAAHAAGVVHRDVKPHNVMIARGGRVVLTDFGIAAADVEAAGSSGTPAYMAPEQARGAPATPAADVYSVGVLLHEMIAGKRAFTGTLLQILLAKDELPQLDTPDAPAPIADAIARATRRDPAARLSSADELRALLAPHASHTAAARVTAHSTLAPLAGALDTSSSLHVVHVAPPTGDADASYLALAVHAALLGRLAALPRVRLAAHPTADATDVALHAERGELAIHVARAGVARHARIAIGPEHVAAAGDVAAALVTAALAPVPTASALAAEDLFLRAREEAQGGVVGWSAAVETLERAAQLAPGDSRIAARFAMALLQRAFFAADADRVLVDRARVLVGVALATAPDWYESHLAAGALELNTGDAARAAAHFRVAIGCAPSEPGAHEHLGRMLLEAGRVDAGLARVGHALAMAPHTRAMRWVIARAHALDDNWDAYDALVVELAAAGQRDPIGEMRFMLWRSHPGAARSLRDRYAADRTFEPELLDGMFAVACDHAWPDVRAAMLALAREPRASPRRSAMVAQLVAECAGAAGDAASCATAIGLAIDAGLFDLHWLDRCPALACLRGQPGYPSLRLCVSIRADAIYDALYGDHALANVLPTRHE
jgi:serine/threonine-protein kinase|nr:protein kinase [Kofleriaceae bacterium]